MDCCYEWGNWISLKKPYLETSWEIKKSKIVGCKWVFKRNEGIIGVEDARFKACLVDKRLHTKERCRLQWSVFSSCEA